jgi:DNA-binding CsgD family transcriptional regulator
MAFVGGVWGTGLSLTVLMNLKFDAFPFISLLVVLNSATVTIALWRKASPQWRVVCWLGVGSLLSVLVYLSRFSIGIYLIPAAALTLFAGLLAFPGRIYQVTKKTSYEDEIHSQPRQTNTLLSELTPREHEVLILLMEGKSNQAIAEKLVVSPNTVRRHVHQILKKLNCTSRGEAAAIARAADFGAVNMASESQTPHADKD